MIYLLRHAETEWNFQLRKQGLDDSPLTDRGRIQAEKYGVLMSALIGAERIRANEVALHHSPLGRTSTTARYLVDALDLDDDAIQIEPRLIEFDYGDWSGLTNEQIEEHFPGELARRDRNKWNYTVPNGQSYADVQHKVESWIDELDSTKITIAVTHSVVSRVIRGHYLEMSPAEAGLLEHPQDIIFRLSENQITAISIDCVEQGAADVPDSDLSVTSF